MHTSLDSVQVRIPDPTVRKRHLDKRGSMGETNEKNNDIAEEHLDYSLNNVLMRHNRNFPVFSGVKLIHIVNGSNSQAQWW